MPINLNQAKKALIVLPLILSACGSDDDSNTTAPSDTPNNQMQAPKEPQPAAPPSSIVPPVKPITPPSSDNNENLALVTTDASKRVLVLMVDGLNYNDVQNYLTTHSTSALKELFLYPMSSGGDLNTPTQTAVSNTPSIVSLMTGTWANRHLVNSETNIAPLSSSTQTIFNQLKASPALSIKNELISTQDNTLQALSEFHNQGVFNQFTSCSMTLTCMSSSIKASMLNDDAFIMAQLGATPGITITKSERFNYIEQLLKDIKHTLAQRKITHPNESWMLLVGSDYGSDKFNSVLPTQSSDVRNVFIASNQALARNGLLSSGQSFKLVDIAPTISDFYDLDIDYANYPYDGTSMSSTINKNTALVTLADDEESVELNWDINTTNAYALNNLSLYRNGELITNQLPMSGQYIDSTVPFSNSGNYPLNYSLVVNQQAISLYSTVAYTAATPLATSLTQNIVAHFPMNAWPVTDVFNRYTLTSASQIENGSVSEKDNFKGQYQGKALSVDATKIGSDQLAGYRLRSLGTDITSENAFTMGFWLKLNNMCTGNLVDAPIVANKNWTTGGNAGLAVGLFSGCNIRFNMGGSGRVDLQTMYISDSQWTYIAYSVNKTTNEFKAYVFDPIYGYQTESKSFSDALETYLKGLNQGFMLNEDGRGIYYVENAPGSPRTTMDFNDLSLWNRALTEDEIKTIFSSRRPLSTLNLQ